MIRNRRAARRTEGPRQVDVHHFFSPRRRDPPSATLGAPPPALFEQSTSRRPNPPRNQTSKQASISAMIRDSLERRNHNGARIPAPAPPVSHGSRRARPARHGTRPRRAKRRRPGRSRFSRSSYNCNFLQCPISTSSDVSPTDSAFQFHRILEPVFGMLRQRVSKFAPRPDQGKAPDESTGRRPHATRSRCRHLLSMYEATCGSARR